ncbi:MAG: hypothetical protein KatS3mg131_0236 [Candidatus Tectimicrobiota bacterium]|nr:MAG: hypothetical protein KatS3mg131_0236 [Candidatus Tectomicrobia bacterium]
MGRKDPVILVADADMEHAMRGLLSRPQALGIREGITFDMFRHPRRDPGVFHTAHDFLRPLQDQYGHALVLLDREGSGQERRTPQEIEADIQRRHPEHPSGVEPGKGGATQRGHGGDPSRKAHPAVLWIYKALAERVSLLRCQDLAFQRFRREKRRLKPCTWRFPDADRCLKARHSDTIDRGADGSHPPETPGDGRSGNHDLGDGRIA